MIAQPEEEKNRLIPIFPCYEKSVLFLSDSLDAHAHFSLLIYAGLAWPLSLKVRING
jgi:hypothetical protein